MSRRGDLPNIPDPVRASDEIIKRCRSEVDNRVKSCIRFVFNRVIKFIRRIDEVGEGFQLGLYTSVPAGSKLGRFGYIGKGFYSPSPVTVGDLCMISTNVTLIGNDHGVDNFKLPIRLDFRWEHKVTIFESDVWVGHGAIIRAGVKIGRGAVVGAGSVVTKDVLPYSIVAGNPAKVVRLRFNDYSQSVSDRIILKN